MKVANKTIDIHTDLGDFKCIMKPSKIFNDFLIEHKEDINKIVSFCKDKYKIIKDIVNEKR